MAQGGTLAIQLSADSNVTALQQDLVVKQGSRVFLHGNSRILRIRQSQIRVEQGAQLCLYGLSLVGGTVWSADDVGTTVQVKDGKVNDCVSCDCVSCGISLSKRNCVQWYGAHKDGSAKITRVTCGGSSRA